MTDLGRIHFMDNPWPGGHAIADFQWTARLDPRTGIWFDLHLETEDYYLEDSRSESEEEGEGDWKSKIVWNNYHRCTLSSTRWGGHGFLVATKDEPFNLQTLEQRVFHIDPLPAARELLYEEMAFNIYLLGHDAVADHQVRFKLHPTTNATDIDWSGQIALAYTGDYEYRYQFAAQVANASFAGIRLPGQTGEPLGREMLAPFVVDLQQFVMDSSGCYPVFKFA